MSVSSKRARAFRRLGVVAMAGGLIASLTACDPPLVLTRTVTYDCQINPNHVLLSTFSDTLDGDYTTEAPQAVKPGSTFEVKLTPEPIEVEAGTSGGSVSNISNVVWKVSVPANSTLVSHTIDGWANVGPGTPTSSVSGSTITITVPGPVPAGVVSTFPTLTMELTATNTLGAHIRPRIGGSSYANPGLSLNAQVTGTILGTLNPTLKCFPSPQVDLHDILVSNDTSAPVITITAPVAGNVAQGSTVIADYSCSDGSGVGVQSCVGTVADGAAINTATLGAKTFTVTATDLEGKVSTKSVTYTVV